MKAQIFVIFLIISITLGLGVVFVFQNLPRPEIEEKEVEEIPQISEEKAEKPEGQRKAESVLPKEEKVVFEETPKTKLAQKEVKFLVSIPANTPTQATIYLVIKNFDTYFTDSTTCAKLEVYGCLRQPMEKINSTTWQTKVSLPLAGLIRYAYDRGFHNDEAFMKDYKRGNVERFDGATPIYFRYLYASPEIYLVEDVVAMWEDVSSSPKTGTIKGMVKDKSTRNPLIDMTVSIAGVHINTGHNGEFKLKNVPIGKQRVVITTESGKYKPSQKEVMVKENEEAQVNFELDPAKLVKVKFNVRVPGYTPGFAKVRISGNLYQLGSVVWYKNLLYNSPLRYVEMEKAGTNFFSTTLDLYESSFVQYRYHLGRSSINAEVDKYGTILTRSFIVGQKYMEINEEVPRWAKEISSQGQFGISPSLTNFYVTTPSDTPEAEPILMEQGPHIAMYRVPKNQWALACFQDGGCGTRYIRGIASPPRGLEKFEPDILGISRSRALAVEGQTKNIYETIKAWRWDAKKPAYQFSLKPAVKREFLGGVDLLDWYDPDYYPLYLSTFDYLKERGITFVAIPQSWQYISLSPYPELEARSIRTQPLGIPTQDLPQVVKEAHKRALKVVLYLGLASENIPGGVDQIFYPHSNLWYEKWLEEFEKFMLFQAKLARDFGIEMMVLPRVSIFKFQDESYQSTFDEKMKNIITKMKEIYQGKLVSEEDPWAPQRFNFYTLLDYIGFLWAKNLNLPKDASVEVIEAKISEILDKDYKTVYEKYQKPIIFTQVHYASVDGGQAGDDVLQVAEHENDNPAIILDLEEQARIYEGFFRAIANRSWIGGMFPFSYNLILQPGSKTFDIRGKPAEDVFAKYIKEINQ